MHSLITIEMKKAYKERLNKDMTMVYAFSIGMGLVVCISSGNYAIALMLSLFIFLIHRYKMKKQNRIFITNVELSEDTIDLKYFDEHKFLELSLPLNQTQFSIKHYWLNKTRTPYLKIYSNETTISQFEIEEWNLNRFKTIIDSIPK